MCYITWYIFRSLCQTVLLPNMHLRDFEILESRKHSGCCGSEVAQALILNKIPGFAKPSDRQESVFEKGH
ncbi:MAG TPA: hypothetical protein VKA34_05410 [Balneolales bacterium]|nr:hypothetical protein [Balneolales bacterium]